MPTIKCVLLGKEKRPFVATWVSILNYLPTPISFLIDTGADKSILSTRDAKKMGINLDDLIAPPDSIEIGGLGGIVPNRNLGIIKGKDIVSIKFMSTDGWYKLIRDNDLIVLKHTYGYKLPSVLGVDFLNEYDFKFHIDFEKNCVEFGNWACKKHN